MKTKNKPKTELGKVIASHINIIDQATRKKKKIDEMYDTMVVRISKIHRKYFVTIKVKNSYYFKTPGFDDIVFNIAAKYRHQLIGSSDDSSYRIFTFYIWGGNDVEKLYQEISKLMGNENNGHIIVRPE